MLVAALIVLGDDTEIELLRIADDQTRQFEFDFRTEDTNVTVLDQEQGERGVFPVDSGIGILFAYCAYAQSPSGFV